MDFATLLGQYVFPIVACFFMAIYVKDQGEKHREDIQRLNANHKEESKALSQAIENNTRTMEKLILKLED